MGRRNMNMKESRNQFRAEVQKQRGKLTNDDLDLINGEYDTLISRLQEQYGYEREEAEREVDLYFEQYRYS